MGTDKGRGLQALPSTPRRARSQGHRAYPTSNTTGQKARNYTLQAQPSAQHRTYPTKGPPQIDRPAPSQNGLSPSPTPFGYGKQQSLVGCAYV